MKNETAVAGVRRTGARDLVLILVAACLAAPATRAADLGKVMPMGDSITLGVPVNGGYRDPLYALLTNRSDTFTFVGTQTGYATTALTAAGQTHHEGHSGYVITNGTSRSGLDENLASWIGPGAETPDKILLMIGSNDINLGYDMANAPTRLSNLVTHIYSLVPNVKLYLASIIPMSGHESDVLTFNAAIPGIAASHRALGRNVVYVPMHDALNIGTDLNDGLHPNASGYAKMAAAWDAALHTNSTHAVDVTGAGGGAGGGASYSVGWEFSVTQSVVVTSLGQFDPDSHPTNCAVALYQKGAAKIVEAAILTNRAAEVSGNYAARYVPVASTVLTAGTYVVFSTQGGENFIAPNGSPSATFGSAIRWNKGVAQNAGALPATAPATWTIENTTASNYFGPTFTYDVATSGPPLAVSVTFPANNRAFAPGATVTVTATVANGTSPYTVQFYRKVGNGAFAAEGVAQSGAGPAFALALGALSAGTNQVYAVVTDGASPQAGATSATNTFFVASGTHAVDVTGVGGGVGLGTSFSVGWDFTVTQPIVVTSLGQLDPDANATSNTVVIYRRGGAKVVEAAVLAASPFEPSGAFSSRYVPVAGVLLTNGNYVVFSTQNGENFVAPNGTPTVALGSAITWNKGVANTNGSAYAPPPATAPAVWPIENASASRYFGPIFKYDLAVQTLALSLDGPTNGQTCAANRTLTAAASVASATGAYVVHLYTNSGANAFAEAGTGGSASTYRVNLGLLPAGTYHLYATASDTLSSTNTATNTFTVVAGGQQPIGLTGWNQDLIVGASESAPGYSANMGGWNFYEKGLSGGTQGLAPDGGGTNRTFTSARNPSVRFQFQPYTNSNALYLDGPTNLTLTLTTPAKFQSLQILEVTRTMSWYAKLNFADGSSSTTATWSDPDWTSNPGPSDRCLTTYGLKSTSGSFYTGYLWMAQRDIALSVADQNKTLTSITFVTTGANSYQLAVFAVSGYALDSLSGVNHAVELTGAGGGASGGTTYSVGWDFAVTQPIRIKALGQFDPSGVAVSNKVALYQRSGAKVVETAVLAASPSEYSGNFAARYAAVADVVLTNGNYVVVSTQNGNNFISSSGSPTASFGPGVTWNKGVAMASGSSAGPLPDVAPASWAIEDVGAFRYFGPTFAYELVTPPPAVTLASPTNGQTLAAGDLLAASVTVARAIGAYTVHVYTNSGSAAFAEAGAGGSASPYLANLGLLPAGDNYHIYATVSDAFSTTNTATNTFAVAVKIGQQMIGLTGWNQDLIIGASETLPGYTTSMSGWNYYERGLAGSTQGLPADVAGTNRAFTSSADPSVKFMFAPYAGKNALFFEGAGSATLALSSPSKFYSLQLLEVARSMSWYATLNFADGSHTSTTNWNDPDWIVNPGPADRCLTSYGLKNTSGSFYSSYLWMAARKITLSAADRAKTLNSITITTSGTSSQHLALFAASGYALGSTTNNFHAVDVLSAGDGAAGGGSYSVGWDFTVSEPITVTALGQFDPDSNAKTNSVVLYQRAGAKLAEVTVFPASSAEPSGNYSARYAKTRKLVLQPGNYVIVSTQNGDNFVASGGNPAAVFGPAITWNKGVAMASGSSAGPLPSSAPATWAVESAITYRYFGPTFKYELGAIWPAGTLMSIR